MTTAQITGIGPLNLPEAIRIVNSIIRFYRASTLERFGKVQTIPQMDETPFYQRSLYGVTKLYALKEAEVARWRWANRYVRHGHRLYGIDSGACAAKLLVHATEAIVTNDNHSGTKRLSCPRDILEHLLVRDLAVLGSRTRNSTNNVP